MRLTTVNTGWYLLNLNGGKGDSHNHATNPEEVIVLSVLLKRRFSSLASSNVGCRQCRFICQRKIIKKKNKNYWSGKHEIVTHERYANVQCDLWMWCLGLCHKIIRYCTHNTHHIQSHVPHYHLHTRKHPSHLHDYS